MLRSKTRKTSMLFISALFLSLLCGLTAAKGKAATNVFAIVQKHTFLGTIESKLTKSNALLQFKEKSIILIADDEKNQIRLYNLRSKRMTIKSLDSFEFPTQSLQIIAMPDFEPNSKRWQLKEKGRSKQLNLSTKTYEHSFAYRWGTDKKGKGFISGGGLLKEDKAELEVTDELGCGTRINKLFSALYSLPNLQGVPIYQKIHSQSKPRLETVEMKVTKFKPEDWAVPKNFSFCKTVEEVWQSGSDLDQLFGEPSAGRR